MNQGGKEGGEEGEMAWECPEAGEVPAPSPAGKVGERSPEGGEVHTEGGCWGGWGQAQSDWRHLPAPGAAPLSPTFLSSNLDGTRPNHQCGFH